MTPDDLFALGVRKTQESITDPAPMDTLYDPLCDDPEYCDHGHDEDDDREWPGGPLRGDF